jgi:hypothetical protein
MSTHEPNSKILVVDGDTPIFRFALALEKKYIEASYKKSPWVIELDNITQFKGGKLKGKEVQGELHKMNKSSEIELTMDDFNIKHKVRLINAKSDESRLEIGKRNARNYISDLYQIPWVKEIKYCLSSKNNFRKNIDKNYKSSRGKKPLLLNDLKSWFEKEFKSIITIIDGLEADDLLGIMGNWSRNYFKDPKDSDIVLCGYDKDLLQIYNNYFFNFDHREDGIFWINELDGQRNLCHQILTGDTTDDIKGLEGISDEIKERFCVRLGGCGKGKAEKILSDCCTVECLYERVEWCYMSYYQDDYKDHLNKQFKLVKLLENKDKIEDFPFTR